MIGGCTGIGSRSLVIVRTFMAVIARSMRTTLNIAGAILILFGAIWFLQGINVLPGSFMTGQIRWAVYGGIAVAVGTGLLLAARRTRRRT